MEQKAVWSFAAQCIPPDRWATYKKPTAQTGTFGFADTQSQR